MGLNEGLVLNGLDLNSAPEPVGPYGLEAVDFTPPKKKLQWAEGADSDGALLLRPPLYEKRTITAKIRIEPQPTKDAALEKVAAIGAQLQAADNNPDGIPLVWTPSQATGQVTFYVLTGEVTGLPITVQGDEAGWFVHAPVLTISLTCKPFGYGEEEEIRAAVANETGLSIAIFTVAGVKGDVPAEGRLVLKDTAGVKRRYLEWGLESRYLNPATKLVIDSEDLAPVGGAQSTALNGSGAYRRTGATKGTLATTLVDEPTICANTGVLAHIGTFRVKARVQAVLGSESTAENVHLRFAYQDGEGPIRPNEWTTTQLGNTFTEVDLGIVTLTQAETGTQKWLGQIEAFSENTPVADTLHIDYLALIPVLEGYGKARGQTLMSTGSVEAYDAFHGASGSLNGRTPEIGGAWATSGVATDWNLTGNAAERSTTNDHGQREGVFGGILGSSQISATMIGTALTGAPEFAFSQGLILRYVNSKNYAYAEIYRINDRLIWEIGIVVGGTPILQEEAVLFTSNPQIKWEASLIATPDGVLTLIVKDGPTLSISHADLAAGGVLASGKAGIFDEGAAGNSTRSFEKISVVTLAAIPYCMENSRATEFRSDSTLMQDVTGVYYGNVPEYRGSRLFVPCAGAANQSVRVIAKADRNDLEEADQQTIGDSFTAALFATPRYLVVPT